MAHQTRSMRILTPRRSPEIMWSLRPEASLNWLALGLLLAAWNASDNDIAPAHQAAMHSVHRPQVLRGYANVSVRAVNRVTSSR